MLVSSSFATLCATLLSISSSVLASPTPVQNSRRQIIEPISGFIIEPTDGTAVSAGSTFPFQYDVDNYCEQGYTPFTVWIVPGPDPPTPASLNSTQEFSDETYLAYLGAFLVANFGLPTMSPGPPPPTFTTPTLDSSADGTTVYLTVVQKELGCFPDGHPEWDISSVAIDYTA